MDAPLNTHETIETRGGNGLGLFSGLLAHALGRFKSV
jgi:hypothetical protein